MPHKYDYNGVTFYVGKNARENWNLIDNAEDYDIWIHLHDFPSSHVIIETLEELDETYIQYGCMLCKKYSKYRYKEKVRISILQKKYVQKGKKTGEANLLKSPRIVTI